MGIMRYTHFVTAFVFIASLLLRTYWSIVGNEWASWRGLFPFLTADGRKALADAFKYYFFLRREPPEVIGHNALAGLTYAFIVFLYLLQTVTGFALLGEVNTVVPAHRLDLPPCEQPGPAAGSPSHHVAADRVRAAPRLQCVPGGLGRRKRFDVEYLQRV
jgi:hypothetical protein